MDVLCIGETIADIITRPVAALALDNDCTGVEEITIKTGGDALNNAIDLAVIGNDVAYVGRIGSDFIGDHILAVCRQAGVSMEHVTRSPSPHTKMNVLMDRAGNRAFYYYPGASAEFSLEDLDLTLLEQCRVLQLSSTFHLPRFDGAAGAVTALRRARELGVLTSMDVTKDLTGRWDSTLRPCYPYLDYFLPSVEQAEILAGTDRVEDMAAYFLAQGVRNVVVKLGDRGCYCRTGDRAFYCGCHQVPVVETTGAGDAFVAGFLSGVLREYPIEDCVRLGTAASAHVIQCVGANTGIRDLETLRSFMRDHPVELRYVPAGS